MDDESNTVLLMYYLNRSLHVSLIYLPLASSAISGHFNAVSKSQTTPYSQASMPPVVAAWERFKKRFDVMTDEEKLQTFVKAGILTKKGRLTKPYREMENSTIP